jgi:hypothetical protein
MKIISKGILQDHTMLPISFKGKTHVLNTVLRWTRMSLHPLQPFLLPLTPPVCSNHAGPLAVPWKARNHPLHFWSLSWDSLFNLCMALCPLCPFFKCLLPFLEAHPHALQKWAFIPFPPWHPNLHVLFPCPDLHPAYPHLFNLWCSCVSPPLEWKLPLQERKDLHFPWVSKCTLGT